MGSISGRTHWKANLKRESLLLQAIFTNPKNWTPIWVVKRTFMFRRKAVVRQQFPLKASSAKTIHKAQGQTKSQVIVDMTTGSRPNQHCATFSRVTSFRGLHLLNGLNGQIKVDKAVIQERERLH